MVRRGITSGCDAFFMPKNITAKMLQKHQGDRSFRQYAGGATRNDVVSVKLKIIEAGDGSVHPIEAEYLAPEVYSLMKVDRPCIRATDFDRFVLLVGEEMNELKTRAPWAYRYLRYGNTATFASKKSKAVPAPERSTCASRDPWYDLIGLVRPGVAFCPMVSPSKWKKWMDSLHFDEDLEFLQADLALIFIAFAISAGPVGNALSTRIILL